MKNDNEAGWSIEDEAKYMKEQAQALRDHIDKIILEEVLTWNWFKYPDNKPADDVPVIVRCIGLKGQIAYFVDRFGTHVSNGFAVKDCFWANYHADFYWRNVSHWCYLKEPLV